MKFKKILLFASVLYLTLYIPLTYTIYSSSWYELNYEKQGTYNLINKELSMNSTTNLINYFYHKDNLNNNWNLKEKTHFSEVRNIYDILFLFSLINFLILIYSFNKNNIAKYSIINLIIILLSFLLIPFFTFFWNKIFHRVLFSNNLWILNKNDLSYYLFPNEFFIHSFILILLISITINLLVYIIFKIKRISI